MNEKMNSISNKSISINNTNTATLNTTTSNTNSNMNLNNNKVRKRQEQAFQNFFKNQKNKIEWDKVQIKILQNNEFFIGILEPDEKNPKKGILVTARGEYYDGEFVNGKKEGEG